jgi:hypothetical protein
MAPPTAEQQKLHNQTVEFLSAVPLDYRFAACMVPVPDPDVPASWNDATRRHPAPLSWSRVVFSKPTPDAPEPAVTVFADLEVVEASPDGSAVTYAVLVEGQKLRRTVVRTAATAESFFNQAWVDKVFAQKMAILERYPQK